MLLTAKQINKVSPNLFIAFSPVYDEFCQRRTANNCRFSVSFMVSLQIQGHN
jgi:hypothetical protein